MKTVTDAGAAADPANFVSNTLEIAVPKGNPGKISGLSDFSDAGLKIAICAPEVPCGAAAVKVFAAAKITPKPDTLESDVKATLQKVSSDEVDAALVYKTDVVGGREQGRRHQFPRIGPGGQRVPDRHLEGVEERSHSSGVRRLRVVGRRPGCVDRGRVCQAVGSQS